MKVIFLKIIQTNQDNLEGFKKYIKTLKLLAILSASSLVHVQTILNFFPSPKISLDVMQQRATSNEAYSNI